MELGHSGIFVKPLCIGTMQWGTTCLDGMFNRSGIIPQDEIDLIFEEMDMHGINFLDSAEGYGGGTSEKRISTRGGNDFVLGTKFLPTFWRWTKRSFIRALKGSLKKSGKDVIDVYFIHTPVHPLPVEFWIECAVSALEMGLIRAIGVSNFNADQVMRASDTANQLGHSIACNQLMFNLLDYNSENLKEVLDVCKELGITVIAFSPIGQGLLTENLTEEKLRSIRLSKITGVVFDDLVTLRETISEIADNRGKTMAQVCLNWVICHDAIPLVGVTSINHFRDNVQCLGWKLTEAEVEQLDSVALSLSTLNKPKWRRGFFVIMISLLILIYRIILLVTF